MWWKMRHFPRRLCDMLVVSVLATLAMAPISGWSQGIEGASERYRFEPGDKVIYEADLVHCPVGEFLSEWRILRGGYECARFADRIWIRPLEHGTTLALLLPEPLPEEFSIEFVIHAFPAGNPRLELALHPDSIIPAVEASDAYAAGRDQLVAITLPADGEAIFAAKDRPAGNLAGRADFRTRLAPGRDHAIAVELRRGQIRFFVDGVRVGHRPLRPGAPIRVMTMRFLRSFDVPQPFADAPVLVGGIRIAAYGNEEAAPEAEADLIRALGAEQTAEGLKVTLAEAILFDLGRWDLKPEAGPVLDRLARLARLRQGEVLVEGHTDDLGSESFNRVLSELRAHVVALALARRGVDPARIIARGWGEARPLVPNTSDENRARNRRVEVILRKPQ
ncbi:MAG: OmpA family protein, partial [Alphaproteobacteria bacterium]